MFDEKSSGWLMFICGAVGDRQGPGFTLGGEHVADYIAKKESSYLQAVGVDKIRVIEQALCRKLWNGLREIPGVKLYGSDLVERRSPIVAFNYRGTRFCSS